MLPRRIFSWAPPDRAFSGERLAEMHCKTMFLPSSVRFFLVSKKTFFWGAWVFLMGVINAGRARHPGPVPRFFTPGQLSIEFVNVGGWLTSWRFSVGFLCSVPCCS